MGCLRVIRSNAADFGGCWGRLRGKLSLAAHLLDDRERLESVRVIIDKVRKGGDGAVAELTAAYDKVELRPSEFRVGKAELAGAHKAMDANLLKAVRESIANVRSYQETIKVKQLADWENNGVRLGLRYRALERVGVCVPGASAPLVSTVIMTVVPAQVAGVKEIAVISSPSYEGSIHPAVLGVCYELGVDEVYRVSGAQAVAALAFGTENMAKVDKIVGPSNWWGQLAKKELFGLIDIDSFAGPSEVLVLADDSANAAWVAADMLSQAEHAPGSAILVTDSQALADEVAVELEGQLAALGRAEETRKCVEEFSLAVVTGDMDEAIELANEFAAEHLQVQCADSDAVAERVVNAGAIFVGHYSPVATGDYLAGPSHTLPTGGSARFFGALNVNDFLKQSSVISYSADGLKAAAGSIGQIADAEGLGAHGQSVRLRVR
ncbi:MAG: histidinol dehydrogenase [Sedimentisphaerales bacterium]|nr:histidinol dehydrogenase [Sedimentisphaerales bacterium]